MLNKLIARCIAHQIDQGILKEDEREAYEYGYFLMALEILNISVMVLIGILFHCLFPLVFFTLCLILLRKYAGGVHASSYTCCAALSALLELTLALLLRLQLWPHLLLPLAPVAFFACIIIWVLSPVAASAKPLSDDETLKYRGRARRSLSAELLIALFLLFFHQGQLLFLLLANFVIIASAMLLAIHRPKTHSSS